MSSELPDSLQAEALNYLTEAIASDGSFIINANDIATLISGDHGRFGDDENFDVNAWDQAMKEETLALIKGGDLEVEFIDRPLEPMVILEVVRFETRYLYYAVSMQAVNAFRNSNPQYSSVSDYQTAVAALDQYHQTVYLELFPKGDEYNKINLVTKFADNTSDKLLIKVTNKTPFPGTVRWDIEQRVEFFVYDIPNKRMVQLVI